VPGVERLSYDVSSLFFFLLVRTKGKTRTTNGTLSKHIQVPWPSSIAPLKEGIEREAASSKVNSVAAKQNGRGFWWESVTREGSMKL